MMYNLYAALVFFVKIFAETHLNFLNNIGLIRRRKATLPDDLNGKTVVITGANSGIGKITAKECARLGAKVFMLCRDVDKARSVQTELHNELNIDEKNSNLFIEQLDLSSLKSVRKCATILNSKLNKIDYLINNAGIMMCPEQKTEDGFEFQFATNHLGHFLLTNLLLDKIKASPSARIINLSSIAHMRGKIHFDNIHLNGIYTPLISYGQSKLANLLFTVELARRLKDTNVNVYTVHPGLVDTDLKRHLNGTLQSCLAFFNKLILISPELGAQTTLYCAFDKDIQHETGQYYA